MKRDPRAFLSDVVEACQAISMAVDGISLDDYGEMKTCLLRLIRHHRSSVFETSSPTSM